MQTKSKKTLAPLNRNISQALPIVAAAYGEKFGVKINIGGEIASTNGKEINLPLVGDGFSTDVYWGYLAHECAHVRYTDFSVGLEQGPLGALTNIIEDVRIEQLFERLYPGTKVDFDAIMDHIDKEHGFKLDSKLHPMAIAINYLLVRMNAEYLQRAPCLSVLTDSESIARSALPEGWFIQVTALLGKHMPISSTRDAKRLAELLLNALKKAEEEENKSESKQGDNGSSKTPDGGKDGDSTSNGQENSDSSDGSSPNASDSKSSSDDSGAGDSGEPDDSGSKTQSSSANNGSSDEKTGSKRSAFEPISTDELPKTAHELAQQSLNDNAERSHKMEKPRLSRNTEQVVKADPDFVGNAMRYSATLRAKLLSLVQARDRSRLYFSPTGKKLHSSRLTKVPVGETRIYKKREVKQAPNTAVHLLLDNSGSMSDEPQQIANSATASIAIALNALPKTSVCVSAFPGNGGGTHVLPLVNRRGVTSNATSKCNVISTGSTPMAEAMFHCYRELASTAEERKILIVITDGGANNPEMVEHLNKHDDVLSLAFVIGRSDYLKGMFDYSVVIDNIDELQSKLFELVESTI